MPEQCVQWAYDPSYDRYQQMGGWVRDLKSATAMDDWRGVARVVEKIRDALGEPCPCCSASPPVSDTSGLPEGAACDPRPACRQPSCGAAACRPDREPCGEWMGWPDGDPNPWCPCCGWNEPAHQRSLVAT